MPPGPSLATGTTTTTTSHPQPTSTTTATSSRLLLLLLALLLLLPLLLLLRPTANSTLLCFESRIPSPSASRPPYPLVQWHRIPPLPPSSPLRAARWIILHLPSSPHPPLSLPHLPGWQLLVVPDDPSSPPAAPLPPGSILLSPAHISAFRVSRLLPPRSHLRKTAAYLFAIQHGARKILDLDHRSSFPPNPDPSRLFDLDLLGDDAPLLHHLLLQYSHHDPNRTVVNPYAHFGQPSVWPRGFPLDLVASLPAERFYTQIPTGRQFIQQGLTDGLPDVDSAFYHTRKWSAESFDIRFDRNAPKVALPQGIMAPVNSLNTLFDRHAFWGLMLPISVGPMASDVIRGYFAQRILWEIGGHLTVCPPTMHRSDRSSHHALSEEEDIHVNVGRLIEFLLRWRSTKHTLFERILDLSYAMAVEGFWTEQDVRFTAYWLQDLAAVGYQQPRLMSLELDLPKAAIGHGDRKDFDPRRMPTMHLGAEEVGELAPEIGSLLQWRRRFGNVVLVLYCSRPVERTAIEWRLLYGRVFKTVVILAEENSEELAVERGMLVQAYKDLPRIFDRYTGADGFIFLQDSMILNYWNLLQADMTKLWATNKVPESWVVVSVDKDSLQWIKTQAAVVQSLVGTLPDHFQSSYKKRIGNQELVLCGSEIFYIPQRFVSDFRDLVRLAGETDLHHMVAMPLIFMAMDLEQNFDSNALGHIIYRKDLANSSYSSYYSPHAPAVYPCNVHSEADFVKLIRVMASGDPLLLELV